MTHLPEAEKRAETLPSSRLPTRSDEPKRFEGAQLEGLCRWDENKIKNEVKEGKVKRKKEVKSLKVNGANPQR